MKKILFILFAFALPVMIWSCGDDDPSGNTIFGEPDEIEGEFDKWLHRNYVTPYNIRVLYKFEHNESDLDYQVTPAREKNAIVLSQIIKYLWLEVYDKVAGPEFTRSYVPRVIHIIGSGAYNNNNTFLLGTAEGGMKITLFRANDLDLDNLNPDILNEWYFKTIHHEFAHILHQMRPYPSEFKEISNSDYVQDQWSSVSLTEAMAYQLGFVSKYSRRNANEDFVEVLAVYVTSTPAQWETVLTRGGSSARSIIERKFAIVQDYLADTWDIDIVELRDEVQRRSELIPVLDFETIN